MAYTLPDLDYDYSALSRAISPEIVELHHSKHHATYVAGANTAQEKLAEARAKGDFAALPKLEKDLAFHLGGHVNHSIYWKNMSPDGGGEPGGDVAASLSEHFGSFTGFKGQFEAAANSLQGSGWAALVWDTFSNQLNINQVYDHQNNVPAGQLPLLLLDMWEHSFYLQYKNVKADYVKAWWTVVNWDDVATRLAKAKAADLA
jgi:superoxide dismutase, Fe-Mn family